MRAINFNSNNIFNENHQRKIVISNVNSSDLDLLLMLLENPKKFCGGPIDSYDYVSERRQLQVTFTEWQCAKRVVETGRFKVNQNEYTAQFWSPDILNESKLSISEESSSNQDKTKTIKEIKLKIECGQNQLSKEKYLLFILHNLYF